MLELLLSWELLYLIVLCCRGSADSEYERIPTCKRDKSIWHRRHQSCASQNPARYHHSTGLNFWTLLPQSVSAT
jgi:hypothetical protein